MSSIGEGRRVIRNSVSKSRGQEIVLPAGEAALESAAAAITRGAATLVRQTQRLMCRQLPAPILMDPDMDEAKMSGIDGPAFLGCFDTSDCGHHSRIAVRVEARIERFVLDLMINARPSQ